MSDTYRLLILTEKIPELVDLASALESLAGSIEVVMVEEVPTLIGRLWMEEWEEHERHPFHLVLLPDVDKTKGGMEVLKMLSRVCCIEIAPVMLTTSASADRAIEVLKAGAWEYLSLPLFSLSAFHELIQVLGKDVNRWWEWSMKQRGNMGCRNGFRKKMVGAVKQHFDQSFDLEKICNDLCVTSISLYRYFSGETGGSIAEFVRQWRLQGGRVLLRETEEPVYTIADRLGFPSSNSFTNIFTRYVGCSPTEFRVLMRSRESYFVHRLIKPEVREFYPGMCPRFLGCFI